MSRILVPVDRTTASQAALPVANWLARGMHAQVVVLAVGEHPETPEEASEEEQDLERIVARAAARLHDVGVERRTRKAGDPVHGILDTIVEDKTDLVVMATHARSALGELAQGTVAGDVVRASVVPVTLVRQSSRSRHDASWASAPASGEPVFARVRRQRSARWCAPAR